MSELTDFLKKNVTKIPKLNTIEDNKDESLLNIKEGNIPSFVEMVEMNNHLTEKAKKDFYKKFWKNFSNIKNVNFRKKSIGKYLLWFNQKFIGTIDKVSDAYKYGDWKDDRYLIQITNYRNIF